MESESGWKLAPGVTVFLVFACIGVANVIKPDTSRLRPGGEMLTAWNRFQVRWGAALFAGFAIYMLYRLLRDVVAK